MQQDVTIQPIEVRACIPCAHEKASSLSGSLRHCAGTISRLKPGRESPSRLSSRQRTLRPTARASTQASWQGAEPIVRNPLRQPGAGDRRRYPSPPAKNSDCFCVRRETGPLLEVCRRQRAFPCLGGRALVDRACAMGRWGLSPRGRGIHEAGRGRLPAVGSIPVWAGEPKSWRQSKPRMWVYPRVSGRASGASATAVPQMGLSPRGRGSRDEDHRVDVPPGSIPAWAGEPRRNSAASAHARVYPRVGGGAGSGELASHVRGGLSPRGRGSRGGRRSTARRDGSIPAWAGEPRSIASISAAAWVYPRVGGGALPTSP